MLTFIKRRKKKSQGWIMLETLFSLILLVIILNLLQQQTQEHWQSINQLEQNYQQRFQQTQIDRLRRMKQDPDWLLGIWIPVSDSGCIQCDDVELGNWVIHWLSNGQEKIEFHEYLLY